MDEYAEFECEKFMLENQLLNADACRIKQSHNDTVFALFFGIFCLFDARTLASFPTV